MIRIKDIPFFSHLNKEEIKKLNDISSVKTYTKNEILFYEGDKAKYLHVLLSGSIKLFKTNAKSNQIFLHQFFPISLVAELANFENIPYPATAEFVMGSEVMKIDYERLEKDFFKNPNLSLKIIKSLAGKLKIMSEVVTNEIVLTAEAKVAKFLIENRELFSTLKNTQIASLLNITPETFSRTITKFKNKNLIIVVDKSDLEIINEEALKDMY